MKKYISAILSLITVSVFALLLISSCDDNYQQEPVLYTFVVADSNITATTARLTGQIQILGSQQITEYGIEVYKDNITSTPLVMKRTTQPTTDTFTLVFNNLSPSSLYYYWAYARVNTTNVHSQNVPHFTTKAVK